MKKSGFTLVEIMIVVAIIGILAGMGTLAIMKSINGSREKAAESELAIISSAILQLAWDTGKWPNGADRGTPGSTMVLDLSAQAAGLTGNDGTFPAELWKGPYYDGNTVDPWGSKYFFHPSSAGSTVLVGSQGKNKLGAQSGDDDNITVRLDD